MPYTKLFNSIVTSTIWSEDDKTRIVWITMLAIADKNGEVQGSIPGLARIAGVAVDDCRVAIGKFLSPDLDSRTKDDEGRRIEEIDGGWHLLNHRKYREMASKDEAKEAEAKRKARYRERLKRNQKSRTVPDMSHDVPENPHIAEAEADSKADTEAEASQPIQRQRAGGALQELIPKVNSLRPEWKKMPHLSAMEMHTLQGCAHSLEGLDEGSWNLMRDFLAYAPRGAEKLYQVRSREKFLQTPVDTLTAATEWQKTQAGTSAKSNGGKW